MRARADAASPCRCRRPCAACRAAPALSNSGWRLGSRASPFRDALSPRTAAGCGWVCRRHRLGCRSPAQAPRYRVWGYGLFAGERRIPWVAPSSFIFYLDVKHRDQNKSDISFTLVFASIGEVDADRQQVRTEGAHAEAVELWQLPQPRLGVVVGHQMCDAVMPPATQAHPDIGVRLDVLHILRLLTELRDEPELVADPAAS